MKKLTRKQQRFVDAYMGVAAGNGTAAAFIAGYQGSDETLASVAKENLRKPQIQEAIDDCVAADPIVADRDQRQQFWTQIMLDSSSDMRARLKASELLGRSQGDFVEHRVVEDSRQKREADRVDTYRAEKLKVLMEDPEGREAMKKAQERLEVLGFGARSDLALRRAST